jgi:hypothetical protein
MSMMFLSWTAATGYVPLALHMSGQRPSTHQELMLDDPSATYYCILFASALRPDASLPLHVRMFSSAAMTSSVQWCNTMDNNATQSAAVLPLTSMLHRSLLASRAQRTRTVLSDAVEMFQTKGALDQSNASSNGGSTFLEVQNTNTHTIVVQLTYQLNDKTTQHFPPGTLVVPSVVVGHKSSSSLPGTTKVDSDSDVEIIEQPNKEKKSIPRNNQPTKNLPKIVTRLIPIKGLHKRVVAMGFRVSKYTEAKPIQLLHVGIHASLNTPRKKLEEGEGGEDPKKSNWLFGELSLLL